VRRMASEGLAGVGSRGLISIPKQMGLSVIGRLGCGGGDGVGGE